MCSLQGSSAEGAGKQQESLKAALGKKVLLIHSHKRSIPFPNGSQFESTQNYLMLQTSKARYLIKTYTICCSCQHDRYRFKMGNFAMGKKKVRFVNFDSLEITRSGTPIKNKHIISPFKGSR